MRRLHMLFGRRGWLAGTAVLLAVVGLQGCSRSHWGTRADTERFEAHLDEFQEEVASQLEIKPYQQAGYEALMAQYREVARQWRGGWVDTAKDVKKALEQEPADADAVAKAITLRIQERPSDEQLIRLVEQTAAFYHTLEPDQQRDVRKHLLRHLSRRLD